MTKEINFTKASITSIKPPSKGRLYYRDIKEKGLSLYITSNGTVTYFVRKRVNGKDERIILGRFPEMTVEKARKGALVAKAEVAKGNNPNHEKQKIRNDFTFKQLFDRYIEEYAKLHTRTWKQDVDDINRNVSHWFNRKISSISTEEIRKLHSTFGRDRGIYGANRLYERIRAIYNKAIEWGWDGVNPANNIKKFKEKSRDRFLQADELPRFFKALSEEQSTIARDYIWISLLTGARRANVLAMRWKDINLNKGTWTIQAEESKNQEPMTIPLAGQALDILKQRLKEIDTKDTPFVFPGTGIKGHLADPKKAWKRILKRAEIEDLRIHDLRRTLGSWQAATGANSFIIGKSLGHKSPQATSIYARLDLDPVRESMERATEAMLSTISQNDTK